MDNKEHLDAIIKLIEFKIESTNRDNERRLRQFKASQNLQRMDLEEILKNLQVIKDKLTDNPIVQSRFPGWGISSQTHDNVKKAGFKYI